MNTQKKFILIPMIVIAAILLYCWPIVLTTETLATWRHYLGLILFIPITVLIFKKNNVVVATLLTGVYLLLATFNLLAITPGISTSWIRIGPISTPPIQLISLGLLVLYFCLNMNYLIDMYLNYKEAKQRNNAGRQNNQ